MVFIMFLFDFVSSVSVYFCDIYLLIVCDFLGLA